MFHKVKSVKAMDNYMLQVEFQDNSIKFYDVSTLFSKIDDFQNLENIKGLFETVKVDNGGYGISWNDELDLSCDELWDNGVEENNK